MPTERGTDRHRIEVTAYAKSVFEERRNRGVSLREIGEELGISHVKVKNVLDDDQDAGPKVESALARHVFGGDRHALLNAVQAFAKDHPERIAQLEDDPLPNRRRLRSMSEFKKLPQDIRDEVLRSRRDGDLSFWTWCAVVDQALRLRSVDKAYELPEQPRRRPRRAKKAS
jgi:hypothetical protein